MATYGSFHLAKLKLQDLMRSISYTVRAPRWQGIDVSAKPEMAMREIFGHSLVVPLHAEENLVYWREDIEPNLPWADEHFEERVGGQPLNPGNSWRNWPWGNSADKFRTQPSGPLLSPVDWSYLAGLIDGEGCINFSEESRNYQEDNRHTRVRLIISQKDHDFIESVFSKFQVGGLKRYEDRTSMISGVETVNPLTNWRISAQAEIRWILQNALPYLRLKKDKAQGALRILDEKDEVRQSHRTPSSKLWGKDWELRFDHTYMQRFWPKFEDGSRPLGMHFPYGDLMDLVDHLATDPLSRQAYLPIWFPEDGTCKGRRPCSLGYHFLMRHDHLHLTYYIRSCDLIRHWADDCYLAVRLLLWVLMELRKHPKGANWNDVKPGLYTMHIASLHVFLNDWRNLGGTDSKQA